MPHHYHRKRKGLPRTEILSYALYPTEGADNNQEVLADIKARGAQQVLLFVFDGLTSFRDACKSAYPEVDYQSCWGHDANS